MMNSMLFSICCVLPAMNTVPITTKSASAAETARLGFDPHRLQSMRQRLSEFVHQGQISGAVTLIQRKGRLVSMDAIGYKSLETKEPMAFDTVFQAWSMTKPFTAVAISVLVERGLLRLQDPVQRYLPEFQAMKLRNGQAPGDSIRISQLLNHTSGIGSDTPISDEDRSKMTLKEFVSLVARQPLENAPGTTVQYSGPGISVAGRIVEVVSGVSFEAFLEREIFQKLSLRSSWMFLPEAMRPRLASGYSLEDGKLTLVSTDPFRIGSRFANPAGGLYSTASDIAAWQQAMLDGGAPILSSAMLNRMTQVAPSAVGGSDHAFGLGWSVVRGPGATGSLVPAGTFGHSGAYGTYGWSDPKNQMVGVIMIQRAGGAEREVDVFRTMAYASLVK
jgi:CubicO group peptidase (beta-lactamase class C family)